MLAPANRSYGVAAGFVSGFNARPCSSLRAPDGCRGLDETSEETFRDTQNVVAEGEKNRWFAKDRPEKMRRLMIEHGCNGDEIATAHRVLTDAFPLCNDRNLLAHGDWWHFDTKTAEITVRGDRERAGEEQHRCFSAETPTGIAERLDDLEVELWRVKKAIERRASDDG